MNNGMGIVISIGVILFVFNLIQWGIISQHIKRTKELEKEKIKTEKKYNNLFEKVPGQYIKMWHDKWDDISKEGERITDVIQTERDGTYKTAFKIDGKRYVFSTSGKHFEYVISHGLIKKQIELNI